MDDRFRELLKTRDYIIFDGAMGTMLQAAGMKMGDMPIHLAQTDISLKNAEKVLRSL